MVQVSMKIKPIMVQYFKEPHCWVASSVSLITLRYMTVKNTKHDAGPRDKGSAT